MSERALFVVAPLVSIVVLIVTAAVRWRLDHAVSVGDSPTMIAARRRPFIDRVPAIGFYGLLVGHVIIVAWPDQLLRWSRNLYRLMAFELTLFALGMMALAGVVIGARRRLLQTDDTGSVAETAFIAVLLVTVVSGVAITVSYRWAAVWSGLTVALYMRPLLQMRPSIESIESMPYLVKLHIFSSFVVVALLAFTRSIDAVLRWLRHRLDTVVGPVVS